MRRPVVVDGRNVLRLVAWPEGVIYRPIGRLEAEVAAV
jgi:hypothetical protein